MFAQEKRVQMLSALLTLGLISLAACQNVPHWDNNATIINICTSDWAPMVHCSNIDPSAYSGYEIELFKKIQRILGWKNDQINWLCIEWNVMIDHLRRNDGVCDIAVAGVDVSSKNTNHGIIFTWPTFRDGYKILVSVEKSAPGWFAFAQAFSWEVWVIAVVTAGVVAVVVWGLDKYAAHQRMRAHILDMDRRGRRKYGDPEFEDYFWESMGRAMQLRDMLAVTFGSNLVILSYGFLMLVLVTLFTANTTANIMVTRLASPIRSVRDLPGKSVVTFNGYVDNLKKYGVAAVGMPWSNHSDVINMINMVRGGTVKAMVLDETVLYPEAAVDCSVEVVGDSFEQYDQAIAFPSGFNNTELLNHVNGIILSLRESGDIKALEDAYIQPATEACSTSDISMKEESKVGFNEVCGLWIVLAVTVGIALMVTMAKEVHLRYVHPRLKSASSIVVHTITKRFSDRSSKSDEGKQRIRQIGRIEGSGSVTDVSHNGEMILERGQSIGNV